MPDEEFTEGGSERRDFTNCSGSPLQFARKEITEPGTPVPPTPVPTNPMPSPTPPPISSSSGSTSSSQEQEGSSGDLSGAAIGTIVLGILLCLALVALVALFWDRANSKDGASVVPSRHCAGELGRLQQENGHMKQLVLRQQQDLVAEQQRNQQLNQQLQQQQHHVPYGPAAQISSLMFEV